MQRRDYVGFGILGAGMIAAYHQQAIAACADLGAQLVALGDADETRFASIEAHFGVPCTTVEHVLANPDIDVVCICTPSGFHAPLAIAAARAGKHVLLEKPMAINLADADAAIEASRESGVLLGVVLQRRTHPLYLAVRHAIDDGLLGDLTLGVVTVPYYRSPAYYAQAAWRGTWALDGGGVLMNQGIHLVDSLVWFMGDPVDVQAYATRLHHKIEVEDTLVATLCFANGAMATIAATTTAAPGFAQRVEVYGTKGGVQIEGETLVRWDLAGATPPPMQAPSHLAPVSAGAGGDPRGISADGHTAIVRDFITALRCGGRPVADGAEGRRSLAAILAIYKAAGLVHN